MTASARSSVAGDNDSSAGTAWDVTCRSARRDNEGGGSGEDLHRRGEERNQLDQGPAFVGITLGNRHGGPRFRLAALFHQAVWLHDEGALLVGLRRKASRRVHVVVEIGVRYIRHVGRKIDRAVHVDRGQEGRNEK